MLSDKWGGNRIHPGTIVNEDSDRLTIDQDLANIFWSQPPVSGVLVPVAAGSIPASSYFWAAARVALVMRPSFTPVPPVWFNPFFSANTAFLSFSTFKANFRAGFNGMTGMTWFSTVVTLSEEGFTFISLYRYTYVIWPVLLYIIILPLAGILRQGIRFVVLRAVPDIRSMGCIVSITPSIIILLVIVVGVFRRTITSALRGIRSTSRVSWLIAFPDLLKHKDCIYIILILQMGDQILVIFPETGKKHCFFIWANSPGWNPFPWFSFSATLISTIHS